MRVTKLLAAALLLATSAACARPRVCPAGASAPRASAAQLTPTAGFRGLAHAHNDYLHPRPLHDALAAGFYSVEADVRLGDGAVMVAHDFAPARGRLVELYLDPLQALVEARGSVHGDGEPFFLWIDLKQGSAELRAELRALLERYPMLSSFATEQVEQRAVTVILTGHDSSKRTFVAEGQVPRACRDSNSFSPDDPPADSRWRYYALKWSSYVDWDGEGALADAERQRLECVVSAAHRLGRRLRFWAAPDVEAYWRVALEVGVDFINTDRLEALSAFLAEHAAER